MTVPVAPVNGSPAVSGLDESDLPVMSTLTRELGRPGNIQTVYSTRGVAEYGPKWADPNRLLRFPDSVKVFDTMLRTDDQVDAVMRAVTLPVLDASWTLVDKGVNPEVTRFVRKEIGLPAPGKAPEQRRRGAAGIVFTQHLEELLDMLGYGFMPFEQVYGVTFPGDSGHPDGPHFAGTPAVHLRKLAQRPPVTIRRFIVAADGGLVKLIQHPIEGTNLLPVTPEGDIGLELPVNRLVVYVNGRKGADWSGVSILRSAYRPWKTKEEYCRLDAISAERNSLGLPLVEYDPAVMSREAALDVAQAARSGAEAGVVVPINSCRFSLVGVTGTVPDLGPRIDRYDQAIGRASLAMFLNLGHDNGARALGDTFLSFFTRSLQAVARRIEDTFTEHVIRDLVELNWGPDETYPRLSSGEITAESLPPDALKSLVDAGIIVADDKLEESTRSRYRLPPADTASARSGAPSAKQLPAAGNPFQPAGPPGPGGQPPGAPPGEVPPAAPAAPPNPIAGQLPAPTAAADDAPRSVHVPAHNRKWPVRASLDGYAAYLAAIIDEGDTP